MNVEQARKRWIGKHHGLCNSVYPDMECDCYVKAREAELAPRIRLERAEAVWAEYDNHGKGRGSTGERQAIVPLQAAINAIMQEPT